jgi:hypothetical protein
MVVLGVREGNMYMSRGLPMCVVVNKRRDRDNEKVAPPVVR